MIPGALGVFLAPWRCTAFQASLTRLLRLLINVVQRSKSPTILCQHEPIDHYLVSGGVLTTDSEFLRAGGIDARFGIGETDRGIAFMIENVAVAFDELGFAAHSSHAIGHGDRKLREARNRSLVFVNHRCPEFFPKRVARWTRLKMRT